MGKKKGEAAALAIDLMAAAATAAGAMAEAVEAVGVKMGGRATPPPTVSPSGAPSRAHVGAEVKHPEAPSRAHVGAEVKHPEAATEREEMLELLDQYREKLRKDRGAKEQSGGLLFYFVVYDAVVVLLICLGWLVLLTRGLVVPSSVFR